MLCRLLANVITVHCDIVPSRIGDLINKFDFLAIAVELVFQGLSRATCFRVSG